MSKIPLIHLRKIADVQQWLGHFGKHMIAFLEDAGGISIFFWRSLTTATSTPLRWRATLEQAYKIGVASLPLVMLTSLFT